MSPELLFAGDYNNLLSLIQFWRLGKAKIVIDIKTDWVPWKAKRSFGRWSCNLAGGLRAFAWFLQLTLQVSWSQRPSGPSTSVYIHAPRITNLNITSLKSRSTCHNSLSTLEKCHCTPVELCCSPPMSQFFRESITWTFFLSLSIPNHWLHLGLLPYARPFQFDP